MGKRSVGRRAPDVAPVAFLIGPERQRPSDDGTCRDGSEVAAVDAVPDVPVHEEELALGDEAAALPERQIAPDPVALQRVAHLHIVDGDGTAGPTNALARQAENTFQEGTSRAT